MKVAITYINYLTFMKLHNRVNEKKHAFRSSSSRLRYVNTNYDAPTKKIYFTISNRKNIHIRYLSMNIVKACLYVSLLVHSKNISAFLNFFKLSIFVTLQIHVGVYTSTGIALSIDEMSKD